MSGIESIPRKKATCPLCGALLCTGILGQSIQILCRGKDGQKCNKLIDVNFTEGGVGTEVVTLKQAVNE